MSYQLSGLSLQLPEVFQDYTRSLAHYSPFTTYNSPLTTPETHNSQFTSHVSRDSQFTTHISLTTHETHNTPLTTQVSRFTAHDPVQKEQDKPRIKLKNG